MPYTWMAFSTMTAPPIKGKTPKEIREYVRSIQDDKMIEVYFDIGKETGYVLFKDLGGSTDIKEVSRKLGATGVTNMLNADQADSLYVDDSAA